MAANRRQKRIPALARRGLDNHAEAAGGDDAAGGGGAMTRNEAS